MTVIQDLVRKKVLDSKQVSLSKGAIPLLYGMGVWTDPPIPKFHGVSTTHRLDLRIWLGNLPSHIKLENTCAQPWYSSAERSVNNQPLLTIWRLSDSGAFWLHYAEDIEFVVDRLGSQVWVTWPVTVLIEDVITYLLGSVMGFILWVRGILCFHASAIAIEGKAIVLLGPSGVGKSSTAAAFAHAGYRILTDDIAALVEQDNQYFVQPAHPHLRLWSETVGVLYGDCDALPWLTPTWNKRCLDLTALGERFQTEPLPLAAIYLLGKRQMDSFAPFIQAVPANQGLLHLLANTYTANLHDKAKRGQEFAILGDLAAKIPVRQVIPHGDLTHLPNLREIITQDFLNLVKQPTQRAGLPTSLNQTISHCTSGSLGSK